MDEYEPNKAIKNAANKNPAKDRKCHAALSRGSNLVSVLHMIIGVHQIAIEPGGSEIGIHGRLLSLELFHARLQLRVLIQQRLVALGIHVGTMLVSPHGPVLGGLIQQPPPEIATVGIVIAHVRSCVICLKNIMNANSARRKRG